MLCWSGGLRRWFIAVYSRWTGVTTVDTTAIFFSRAWKRFVFLLRLRVDAECFYAPSNSYIQQWGSVVTPVCLLVGWLVGWFVSRITQKLLSGFPQNLDGGCMFLDTYGSCLKEQCRGLDGKNQSCLGDWYPFRCRSWLIKNLLIVHSTTKIMIPRQSWNHS